jgi:hypothetical protein
MIKTSNLPIDLMEVTKLAVEHYLDRYFKKRTRDRIDEIKIIFKNVGPRGVEELAYASYEDNEGRLPTEFLIEFNATYIDIPVREYLITLMHEMTHILQYAEGRLKSNHLSYKWMGKKFDETGYDYWNLPWEREALAIELGAYATFADKYPELRLERWKPTYEGRKDSGWEYPVKSTT